MMYQYMNVSEQNFSITFKYNFIDIFWELSQLEEYKKDNIFYSQTWDHSNEILPTNRPQNNYNL